MDDIVFAIEKIYEHREEFRSPGRARTASAAQTAA
jgi:hypothetical protein